MVKSCKIANFDFCQVVSLPTFTACKSESIGQLLAGNMAAVNGGTRTNAEKKSLASKLSGTLNRNNSGKTLLLLIILHIYNFSGLVYENGLFAGFFFYIHWRQYDFVYLIDYLVMNS
jgi:hypothetical protein